MSKIRLDDRVIQAIMKNNKTFEGRIDKAFNKDIERGTFDKKYVDSTFDYSEEDLMLVRTTNQEIVDGTLKTISNSEYYDEAIDYFEWKDENCLKPISSTCRSTLHFTLNGLVGSHLMGDFSGRGIMIFDNFLEHKNDDIMSFACEDTYFFGDVKLSDKAVFCMTEEKYQEMIQDSKNKEYLDKHQVFTYDKNGLLGDLEKEYNEKDNFGNFNHLLEDAVCKAVLIELGKPCFTLASQYYVFNTEVENTIEMDKFLNAYKEEHGLVSRSHYYSDVRKKDISDTINNDYESIGKHFEYIVTHANVSEEEKEKMLKYVPYLVEKPFDISRVRDDFYLERYTEETKRLRELYSETEDKEERRMIRDKISESISKYEPIPIEMFRKDVEEFKNMIGIEQYNELTRQYNEEYRLQRKEELDEKNREKERADDLAEMLENTDLSSDEKSKMM